jgi:hypothetical protein
MGCERLFVPECTSRERCLPVSMANQGADGLFSIVLKVNVPGSTGFLPPPAGAGPNCAETMNTRWFVGSRPMLRDPTGVDRLSMTWY